MQNSIRNTHCIDIRLRFGSAMDVVQLTEQVKSRVRNDKPRGHLQTKPRHTVEIVCFVAHEIRGVCLIEAASEIALPGQECARTHAILSFTPHAKRTALNIQ